MRVQVALVLLACGVGTACAAEQGFRGRFHWGQEAPAFQPCGSAKAYRVLGPDKELLPLRERSNRLRRERNNPYPILYLEAAGALEDREGVFQLTRVTRVSSAVPKDCTR